MDKWSHDQVVKAASKLTYQETEQCKHLFHSSPHGINGPESLNNFLQKFGQSLLPEEIDTHLQALAHKQKQYLELSHLIWILERVKESFVRSKLDKEADTRCAFLAVGGEYWGNGEVDQDYLQNLINTFGLSLDLNAMDDDGDGRLDFEEFSSLFKEEKPVQPTLVTSQDRNENKQKKRPTGLTTDTADTDKTKDHQRKHSTHDLLSQPEAAGSPTASPRNRAIANIAESDTFHSLQTPTSSATQLSASTPVKNQPTSPSSAANVLRRLSVIVPELLSVPNTEISGETVGSLSVKTSRTSRSDLEANSSTLTNSPKNGIRLYPHSHKPEEIIKPVDQALRLLVSSLTDREVAEMGLKQFSKSPVSARNCLSSQWKKRYSTVALREEPQTPTTKTTNNNRKLRRSTASNLPSLATSSPPSPAATSQPSKKQRRNTADPSSKMSCSLSPKFVEPLTPVIAVSNAASPTFLSATIQPAMVTPQRGTNNTADQDHHQQQQESTSFLTSNFNLTSDLLSPSQISYEIITHDMSVSGRDEEHDGVSLMLPPISTTHQPNGATTDEKVLSELVSARGKVQVKKGDRKEKGKGENLHPDGERLGVDSVRGSSSRSTTSLKSTTSSSKYGKANGGSPPCSVLLKSLLPMSISKGSLTTALQNKTPYDTMKYQTTNRRPSSKITTTATSPLPSIGSKYLTTQV